MKIQIAKALMQAEIKINERKTERQPAFAEASADKIGRNDPCPCGSGKKYKKCCRKVVDRNIL